MSEVINFIASVGFPIFACCACFWKIDKQDTAHAAEMNKVVTALNNNTLAINSLMEKINNENVHLKH